jgi:hypothetical protein
VASAEPRGRGKKPWRARYKKPDGTWGSESGFATKAAALAWGRRQEAAIQEGRWIDPGNGAITLDEWWEEWMPAQEYAPGSVITLSGLYRNHLRPWKGDRPIREIRLLDVDNLRKALQTRLGASAVTNVMSLLKMLMEDAVLDGRIGSSPVVSRRRRGRKHKVTQAKATQRGTAIDLRKLLAIVRRMPDCGTGGPVGMVIILIMAFAGLRWGEVTAMQRKYLALFPAEDGQPAYGWYIVDDDEGGVHYRRAPRALGPPKGYVGRTIELPPWSCCSSMWPRCRRTGSCCSPDRRAACFRITARSTMRGGGRATAGRRAVTPAAGPAGSTPRPSTWAFASTTCATPTRPGWWRTTCPRSRGTSG